MEFRAEIKRTLTGPDKLRAVCSVILDDCFLVKNVRVVEGEKGLFVSLPSRRNVKGEWTEQCFPMTKELREKLSAVVLAEYDRALAAQYKKRARNTVIFYVIAESIWQIKDLILYYYS